MCRVANRTNVNQRARQEGTDRVDIDSEAAFDFTVDHALDDFVFLEGCFQNFPSLCALGFFTGQTRFTEAIFNGFQCNVNVVTDSDGQFTILIAELCRRDLTFGFQTSVNGNPVTVNVDNLSRDDSAWLHVDVVKRLFKQFSKAFAHGFPT